LPIVGFYVVAPWLLLLIYFNLLLNFTFLAQRLHRFNAVLAAFLDDIVREEQRVRLFPFPFTAMLIGRPAQWRLRMLLGLMVLTTVVLLPLILLLWAQMRFLPYHDTAITWNHRAAVLVDLMLLWLFRPLMLPPVQRPVSAAPSRRVWRLVRHTASARRWRWGTRLICLTLVTVVFALDIAVPPEEGNPYGADKSIFVPTFFEWLEWPGPFRRNLYLHGQVLVAGDPAAEVVAALRSTDETKRAQGLEKITGLILTDRNLRGAILRDTLFPKADLHNANLEWANLAFAQLQGADWKGANIGSADFRDANLTWSDLRSLLLSPLDKNKYEELEKRLTNVLRDTRACTAILKRLHDAIERPTNLSAARAKESSVLCDNVEVFRSCVTPVQSAGVY
jgi:Pentapeptide repeats (8 copies)